MADIKESAMTQKSDCKWVRALDSNGNSIRISKEDLASVVGGLIGVVELGVKNGLVNKNAGNKVIAIDNTIIRIKINSLYSCTTFAVSMYDGGEVGLFLLSITLNNNLYSKCGIIGSSRTTKIYTKDTDIYIATDSKSNANYTISSFTPHSGVVSVDAIPRQEFDGSYYEVPISSII